MDMQQIKALAQEAAAITRAEIAKSVGPLLARLDALEKLQPLKGDPGEAGPAGPAGADGIEGPAGKDGLPGKDAEPLTAEQIEEAVARYFVANPPKDGNDGPAGADGAPGEKGLPGEAGRDGRDGQPGVPGLPGEKGMDGRDGIDGLGFDDLEVHHDGERTVTLRFVRGDRVKEFPVVFPVVLDKGVWREGDYAKGDGVSLGGQFWIARNDTSDKPDFVEGNGWRLSVKKGRDGKDYRPEEKATPGPVRFK